MVVTNATPQSKTYPLVNLSTAQKITVRNLKPQDASMNIKKKNALSGLMAATHVKSLTFQISAIMKTPNGFAPNVSAETLLTGAMLTADDQECPIQNLTKFGKIGTSMMEPWS